MVNLTLIGDRQCLYPLCSPGDLKPTSGWSWRIPLVQGYLSFVQSSLFLRMCAYHAIIFWIQKFLNQFHRYRLSIGNFYLRPLICLWHMHSSSRIKGKQVPSPSKKQKKKGKGKHFILLPYTQLTTKLYHFPSLSYLRKFLLLHSFARTNPSSTTGKNYAFPVFWIYRKRKQDGAHMRTWSM